MQKNIISAFPKRALTLIDSAMSRKTVFLAIFTMLILWCVGAGLLNLALILAPGIERDYAIAKDAESFPADDIKGECNSNRGLTGCSASFSYRDSTGKRKTTKFAFTFVDFHSGDYDVTAIRSASKPDLVTLNIGLETLWQRIFTAIGLGVTGLLGIGAGVLLVSQALATRRKNLALSGQVLKPVAVKIIQQFEQGKNPFIFYTYTKSELTRRYRANSLGERAFSPFYLDSPNEALAVTTPDSDYAFLLDENLTRLDLSDAERKKLLEARDAA